MNKHSGGRACSAIVGIALVVMSSACGSSSAAPKARPQDQPGPLQVKVTLVKSGCNPQSFRLKPGYVTFVVTNPASADKGIGKHEDSEGRPTEMEIQDAQGHEINDVEGVQPGRTRSFTVKLEAGKAYRVRCPEEQVPWGTITVVR
jgi:uncharacterized cupredoxin-like copper-binding protein